MVLALSKGPEHPNKTCIFFFLIEKKEKKEEKKEEIGSASNIGSVGRVQPNNFFVVGLIEKICQICQML